MAGISKVSIAARFKQKYVESESGCWEWTASTAGRGYGVIWFEGRQQYAHRVSHQIHKGPVPDSLQVLHECDNPKCVNPAHLFLGTQADNVADMIQKGRQNCVRPRYPRPLSVYARGEKIATAKLTTDQIRSIRDLYSQGSTQADLATTFGVNQPQISRIVRRATWKHV